MLAVCSIDGYVSFLIFSPGELGEKAEVYAEKSTDDMEIDPDIEAAIQEREIIEIANDMIATPVNGRKRIVPEVINDMQN